MAVRLGLGVWKERVVVGWRDRVVVGWWAELGVWVKGTVSRRAARYHCLWWW